MAHCSLRWHARARGGRGRWGCLAVLAVHLPVVVAVLVTGQPWATAAGITAGPAGEGMPPGYDAPVSITWTGTPLRGALERFGHAQGMTVVLDRRVDPDQRLDISIDSQPARRVIAEIAAVRGLGVSHLGPVVYLGPSDAAARLRTLVALRTAEVARLTTAARRRFTQRQACHWDDLATPRQLLQGFGHQAGVAVGGLELVPHDLWPAIELPPLSLIDRLTLVANQFDLTFAVTASGGSVRLLPIAAPVLIERRYRHAKMNRAMLRSLAGEMPTASWRFEPGGLVLRGRMEDHERLLAAASGQAGPVRADPADRSGAAAQANRRYTLTVKQQPVGPLVRQLAHKLDLDIEFDSAAIERAGRSLDVRVSLQVNNATVDQLFRAALRPAGLDCARHGRRLSVGPANR